MFGENLSWEIMINNLLTGHALSELSKDKPANKQVEGHVNQFRQTLTNVETELAKQINYLTQVSTGRKCSTRTHLFRTNNKTKIINAKKCCMISLVMVYVIIRSCNQTVNLCLTDVNRKRRSVLGAGFRPGAIL